MVLTAVTLKIAMPSTLSPSVPLTVTLWPTGLHRESRRRPLPSQNLDAAPNIPGQRIVGLRWV